MSRHTRCLFIALLLLVAGGCGREPAKLSPVSGHVYYQGKPLAGGTVVFTPDPERGGSGPMAFAEIKGDGSFTLRTGAEFGAISGWHRVTIAAATPTAAIRGGPSAQGNSFMLPTKYSDPERSGQHCEVKAGLVNTCEIRLD